MIDPAGITFKQGVDKDNKAVWQGRVDIILIPETKKGESFEGTRATVALDLSQERYQAMMQSGLRYVKDLPIHAKADQLKIVVRDNTSTMTGSLKATW